MELLNVAVMAASAAVMDVVVRAVSVLRERPAIMAAVYERVAQMVRLKTAAAYAVVVLWSTAQVYAVATRLPTAQAYAVVTWLRLRRRMWW